MQLEASKQTLSQGIEASVESALITLRQKISANRLTAHTHSALLVRGWEDPEAIKAIAWYMVGQRAQAVSIALRIRAELENTTADQTEVRLNVERIVGSSASPLTQQQKEDERNPWMAEALWHLCLFLSKESVSLRAAGEVVALAEVHVGAKDHGPDIVALTRDGNGFGVMIVETKAYENNPNKAISDAVSYFREVDNGDHDQRLRQIVSHLRSSLDASSQPLVSHSLWKSTRVYLPNPHYGAAMDMNWQNTRHAFRTLKVTSAQVIVMPNCLDQFSAFFDAVGDAMRSIVEKMSYV